MKEKCCLIIDSMHKSIFPLLESTGWKYEYAPDISRNEIKKVIDGYQGLIVRSKTRIDADLIGNNATVRFIGRAGAGIDNLDVDFLAEKKIAILHAAEGNRDAVGEFTLGILLSLMRNIPRADAQVREKIWDREGNRGEEVMGKTVSLIGYGNMGRAFARRLSGFGCKILAYDKYKSRFSDEYCCEMDMDAIFDETDVLSLHIPLTAETRNLVNQDYLSRFRKNIIVVNTARGEIIALEDILKAIESGKVRGAALDVLENEKLNELTPHQQQSFDKLRTLSNVIFTPHIAGWTFESHEKINVALVEKLKALDL